MKTNYEGNAIVYCEGALSTTNGKTAHGLLRRSDRYRIVSVIDSTHSNLTTGEIIPGCRFDVPVFDSVESAYVDAHRSDITVTHLIVGLAPDGGRLPESSMQHLKKAASLGMSIVSGLHDFLSDDRELSILARKRGIRLIDLRKMPDQKSLHFFSGKIEEVTAPRIAVLGTDSAVGKRTTAWMLVDAFRRAGQSTELVGTGQTARLQGAKYGVVFDSLINDFVSGEIEHAVWSAWNKENPDLIVVEGQGSLMNPAYPGGLEILAAARPCCIVLQHAPARTDYDGFPGYPIQCLKQQIVALELVSSKPVAAITINSEDIAATDVNTVCEAIEKDVGLCTVEPLIHGVERVREVLGPHISLTADTTKLRHLKSSGAYWN